MSIAAAIILSAFTALISAAPASAQALENLIPTKGSQQACDLQSALRAAGCFAPKVPGRFDRDCDFGGQRTSSYTRLALRNFFAQKNQSPSSYADVNALLADVQASPGICPATAPGTCRRDTIGDEYLAQLSGVDSVLKLSETLRVAIQNFDAVPTGTSATPIFPPGGADPVKLSQDDLDRIRNYGIEGVTEDGTLTSLEDALYNFDNLVLAYALKQLPKCEKCGTINDWIYLKNIGSRNFGFLIGRDPTYVPGNPAAVLLKRFEVSKIPEDLMNDVRNNVRVYRSVTENLNRLLAAGTATPERLTSLIDRQEEELFAMIEHFDKNAKKSSSPLMATLEATKKCHGFDGSQIYQ